MAICNNRSCACAIQSESLQISGDGNPGNPYMLESTGLTIVTSVTRPGTPFLGQQILETDTDRIYYYDGSTWRIITDPEMTLLVKNNPLGPELSAGTGVFTDWHDLGSVTKPPWASKMESTVAMTLVGPETTALYCNLRLRVGSDFGTGGAFYFTTEERSYTWQESCDAAAGPQDFQVQVENGFGATTKIRASGSCIFSAMIHWKE